MGSFSETNINYPDNLQSITKRYSFSDVLYVNANEKCKKTIKNLEKTFHVDSTYWLNFPNSHDLIWNKNYTNEDPLKEDTLKHQKSSKNRINSRLKYNNDFHYDNKFMDEDGPLFIRNAGGGGCCKKKKGCDEYCIYDTKSPFDVLLTKTQKKSSKKKLEAQRSDICCQNWEDVEIPVACKQDKSCSKDKCAKCSKRTDSKNLTNKYYAECLKEHDKSLGPSDCQLAWEGAHATCDCKKKVEEFEETLIQTTNETEVCDICMKNKATESYKIKKGEHQGHLNLCCNCAKIVDGNVYECEIRSTAGGCCKKKSEEIDCEQGKCVKDCKKGDKKSAASSRTSRPCCPNCPRPEDGNLPCQYEDTNNECIEEKVKKKSNSNYCCNYSKNKKKSSSKLNAEVCDDEKCPNKSKSKESTEGHRTLCECPKGCKCLCSKYSFFDSTLIPNEQQTVTATTEESPDQIVKAVNSDCEDPQVGVMIEELKSEMGSLMKKLEVLGKSQCKCALKREEVVLFATQIINNPFNTNNKLNRYIELNNDSINQSNNDINKIGNLEKNTNDVYIMPPKDKKIKNTTLSVSNKSSLHSVHQNEKKDSSHMHLYKKKSDVINNEKLIKDEDLSEKNEKKLDDIKILYKDTLTKEMIKMDTESSNIQDTQILSANNLRNKIEIVSAKVIKDSNNKKQKLLLHLHMKKSKNANQQDDSM